MEESYSRQRIRWKRCTVQQRDNTRQERAARTLGCFIWKNVQDINWKMYLYKWGGSLSEF